MSRRTAIADGVEFIVEEGLGHVERIEHPEGKRNARVEFSLIDGPALRHPFAGWLDTSDAELWRLASEALATGARVSYRVETHRANTVAPALPIAEVGQTDRFRRLVRLEPAVAGETAAPQTPQEGRNGSNGADHRQAPPSPAPAPQGPQSAPPAPEARRGPCVAEGKPWEETNTDGSINLGSYAAGASIATVELAHELLVAHAVEAGISAPSMGQVVGLARLLLAAADRAQAGIRADGRVDRMDASHTRARGAVRSALVAFPVPWGEAGEVRQQWVDNLGTRALELLTAGLALIEPA